MNATTPNVDTIICGDCLEEMKKLPDRSIDAIVTDPPYELAFMGKKWDASGIAYNVDMWGECLRVLKPGGHLLAFGGARTYHRMACAIEDAGFEIRDSLHWVYGCLSPDTEILINGEWERYQKANIGDLTICYNNETNSYSWQPIQEVFEYRIKDTAYRIQSDLTDQIVTRGHRCLIERAGKLLFCVAEEAAREREIYVPVLEDLHGLLKALSMPHARAGAPEHDMLLGMCKDLNGAGEGRAAKEGQYRTDMPGLRQAVSNLEGVGKEGQNKLLLPALQRRPSGRGLEEARAQRPGGLDHGKQSGLLREDERIEKSGMERRRDLLQNSRELCGCEICPMPSEISIDGPERWICDGAPINSCSENEAMPEEVRGCASYQPRPNRQPLRESSAIQDQPGSQEIRGAGITRTTLARIEPIDYDGLVWCVRVPTGAFIARRNGKIFVTGNSGFPKSLDIGKAIDRSIFTTKTHNPDFQIVRAWVRGKVKAAGLTYKQIDTALGNANSHKASHYLDNSQPQLPTPEDWEIIKQLLKLDESIDIDRPPKLLVETFEREIIGYRKCHAGLAFTSEGPTELPITKPLSKEAEQWAGYGTALKPAHEPVVLARKPLEEKTIAENVLRWGVGGLNIDACRIAGQEPHHNYGRTSGEGAFCGRSEEPFNTPANGRFPSNLIHDGSPEVLAEFAKAGESKSKIRIPPKADLGDFEAKQYTDYGAYRPKQYEAGHDDQGTPARFFQSCPFTEEDIPAFAYYAKAGPSERNGSTHPTMKPLSLMRYLCKLITPPGGLILDPFGGSGTTGIAAIKEGFHYILIEQQEEYCEIARKRVAAVPARLDRWAEAEG